MGRSADERASMAAAASRARRGMKCIRRGMRKANAGLEVGNRSRQALACL